MCMKKIVQVALALAMTISLAACGAASDSDSAKNAVPSEDVIKIGVFEPSTGNSSSGGKKETLGIQYANQETPTITLGDKTYRIELVTADNGSSEDKAPIVASELVKKDVSLVLGSYGSAVSIAGGPKFQEAGLAAIGVTCTNPDVTKDNDYYFRVCFLDSFQGDVIANFAIDKFSAKKAYCLGEDGNEYDQGLITFFKDVFEANGGQVIADSFPSKCSDFASYLKKARSEGADVIFIPVSTTYASQIMKQAAFLQLETPFLGSDTLDDNTVLDAIRNTNLQLYVTAFYQEGRSGTFDIGIRDYINKTPGALTANGGNDTISAATALGYDAYHVALEAIRIAGSGDRAAIKAALPKVKWNGISGYIAFNSIGDAVRDIAYIKSANTATGSWAFEKVQEGSKR